MVLELISGFKRSPFGFSFKNEKTICESFINSASTGDKGSTLTINSVWRINFSADGKTVAPASIYKSSVKPQPSPALAST